MAIYTIFFTPSVIGQQDPAVTGGSGFLEQCLQTLQKIVLIGFVAEYVATLDTPDHHVMENPGRVKSCDSWHGERLSTAAAPVNLIS